MILILTRDVLLRDVEGERRDIKDFPDFSEYGTHGDSTWILSLTFFLPPLIVMPNMSMAYRETFFDLMYDIYFAVVANVIGKTTFPTKTELDRRTASFHDKRLVSRCRVFFLCGMFFSPVKCL